MRLRFVALLSLASTVAFAQPSVTAGAPLEPPPRVGIVVTTGLETVFPVEGGESLQLGLRGGAGLRVGLLTPEGEGMVTVPSVALLGGFAGQSSPRGFVPGGFVEARLELLVVSAARRYLLQPALTVYGVGGVTMREGVVVPHFGLGVGWGVLFLHDLDRAERALSGLRFNNEAAVLLAVVVGLVAAGRLEVRYVPATGNIPATSSALIGFGF